MSISMASHRRSTVPAPIRSGVRPDVRLRRRPSAYHLALPDVRAGGRPPVLERAPFPGRAGSSSAGSVPAPVPGTTWFRCRLDRRAAVRFYDLSGAYGKCLRRAPPSTPDTLPGLAVRRRSCSKSPTAARARPAPADPAWSICTSGAPVRISGREPRAAPGRGRRLRRTRARKPAFLRPEARHQVGVAARCPAPIRSALATVDDVREAPTSSAGPRRVSMTSTSIRG